MPVIFASSILSAPLLLAEHELLRLRQAAATPRSSARSSAPSRPASPGTCCSTSPPSSSSPTSTSPSSSVRTTSPTTCASTAASSPASAPASAPRTSSTTSSPASRWSARIYLIIISIIPTFLISGIHFNHLWLDRPRLRPPAHLDHQRSRRQLLLRRHLAADRRRRRHGHRPADRIAAHHAPLRRLLSQVRPHPRPPELVRKLRNRIQRPQLGSLTHSASTPHATSTRRPRRRERLPPGPGSPSRSPRRRQGHPGQAPDGRLRHPADLHRRPPPRASRRPHAAWHDRPKTLDGQGPARPRRPRQRDGRRPPRRSPTPSTATSSTASRAPSTRPSGSTTQLVAYMNPARRRHQHHCRLRRAPAQRITGRRTCPVCRRIYNIYSNPPKIDGHLRLRRLHPQSSAPTTPKQSSTSA